MVHGLRSWCMNLQLIVSPCAVCKLGPGIFHTVSVYQLKNLPDLLFISVLAGCRLDIFFAFPTLARWPLQFLCCYSNLNSCKKFGCILETYCYHPSLFCDAICILNKKYLAKVGWRGFRQPNDKKTWLQLNENWGFCPINLSQVSAQLGPSWKLCCRWHFSCCCSDAFLLSLKFSNKGLHVHVCSLVQTWLF